MTDLLDRLKRPFGPDHIEWRIQRSGIKNGRPWAMVLAYVDSRAIMDRLDDVVGCENWRDEYISGPGGGVLCGLSIRIGDEWITKWDGAENTNIEAVKGGISGALKRAAVKWGIGRYLYGLSETFAIIDERGQYRGEAKDGAQKHYFRWNPPALPAWALPDGVAAELAPDPDKLREAMQKVKGLIDRALADRAITEDEHAEQWTDAQEHADDLDYLRTIYARVKTAMEKA